MIRADCIKCMPTLPARSFDAIITSPPYRAGKSYDNWRDLDHYLEFAREWTACVPRLLKPTGSFWLNLGFTYAGDNETLPLTYAYYPMIAELGLRLIQEVVWEVPSGMAYKRRFAHRSERWQWWAHDPVAATFNLDDVRDLASNKTRDKRNNPLGKNPTDVWHFTQVMGRSKLRGGHDCPFPEPMIERIVRACTNEGDHILDPFAGTGTVGRVAAQLGRRSTLIDLHECDL